MKKKLISITVVLLVVLTLFGCNAQPSASQSDQSAEVSQSVAPTAEATTAEATTAPPAPSEKEFSLKLAGIKTDDDPASLAMKQFADEVNKNSGGTITVTTFTNSQLGNINDLLTYMQDGTVDMFYNALSSYAWLQGAEKFGIVAAPFLWGDNDEMQAFLSSDTVKKGWVDEAATSSGVRCLSMEGALPPRELTSNKAITNAADFKDLKIRTAESAIVQQTFQKLGATPVVIPFADLYMALKQGAADAQENNFITIKTSSLYEVQKYFMKTDYIRDASALLISEQVWQQMSDTQKQVMLTAARNATILESTTIGNTLQSTIDFLKTEMTYVDIDVSSIQQALGTDIYEEMDQEGKLWPTGTLTEVLAFKESYK